MSLLTEGAILIVLLVIAKRLLGRYFSYFKTVKVESEADISQAVSLINGVSLRLFFEIAFIIFFFLYELQRAIQLAIIDSADFITVGNWGVISTPTIFFGLFVTWVMLEIFFGLNFFKKLFGEEGYKKAKNRLLVKFYEDKPLVRILMILFLGLVGLMSFIFIPLNIDYYAKFSEKGIIVNYWSSLGEENRYSWQDIDKIYLEKGYIRLDTNEYKTKDRDRGPEYILIMKDGRQFDLGINQITSSENMRFIPDFIEEILFYFKISDNTEIVNFVAEQSGKKITEVIWDAPNQKYIEK